MICLTCKSATAGVAADDDEEEAFCFVPSSALSSSSLSIGVAAGKTERKHGVNLLTMHDH